MENITDIQSLCVAPVSIKEDSEDGDPQTKREGEASPDIRTRKSQI